MTPVKTADSSRILVIDDEPDLRTLYELTLLREGYLVDVAASVAEGLEHLAAQGYDLIITDMRLPDSTGIDLLKAVRQQQRTERCIVITAFGSAENAVESLKAGAFDYLTKPVDLQQFRSAVTAAILSNKVSAISTGNVAEAPAVARSGGHRAISETRTGAQQAFTRMVGDSPGMRNVRERIVKVARSMAPVMVQGESGTGKELVANALHAHSHRHAGPWIAVNCGAIPENLLEAEFFGVRKGAYTGASHDRQGFFQAAHGGTLFLDEIGDLPLSMQAKLLRAIQERRVRPLGASQEDAVDVRIVSATHKDLSAEVLARRFRQDLFYRLNVIEITVPSLRERMEDLPALCAAILQRIAADSAGTPRHLSAAALERLSGMPLPGNVRELENLLHRAVALSDDSELELQDLPLEPTELVESAGMPIDTAPQPLSAALPNDLQGHLDAQERAILVRALRETGFNRTLAAKMLGLSLRQIRYRMERLKIDAPEIYGEGSDHGG